MDDHHELDGFDDVGWPEDTDLGSAETHDLGDQFEHEGDELPEPHEEEPDAAEYRMHEPIGYGDDLGGQGIPDIRDVPETPDLVDLHPLVDVDLGEEAPFPPPLDVDLPDPVDGPPWSDPAALGHDLLPDLDPPADPPPVAELFEYAGEQLPVDGDPWTALLGSDDPATSALARWWSLPPPR
jgi:hypothetical protein